VRLHRHHQHRHDRPNDEKEPSSAHSVLIPRQSLEVPGWEGATPLITPSQSRRASVMLSHEADPLMATKEEQEEDVRQEQEKANLRTE
jgi:hypothetical protein